MQFLLQLQQHFPGEPNQLHDWQSKAAPYDDPVPYPQPPYQGEQQQQERGSGKGKPVWQQSQQQEVCAELAPSSLPEGLLRDMAVLLVSLFAKLLPLGTFPSSLP
jgi:hypothetical protein